MKKWIPVVLVAALLLAALPLGAFAHSEGNPHVVTLLAGQDIDAGTVSVWNDGDNLFVKFETSAGWVMTETHLAVATDPNDIPQKNGNPIPGRFTYKHEDLGGVTEDPYTIPLSEIGAGPDGTVYIAAHAALLLIIGDGCGSPQWASTVMNSVQGTLVGGGPVTDPARTDSNAALGAPDASTSPPATGFYSLGFVSDSDGYIVLGFDYPVYNGPGDDIVAYEVTWGRPGYPDEVADVSVVADGTEQYAGTVTNHDDGGVGTVSIPDDSLCVDAVKLVDATDPLLFGQPDADGYDLDSVGACYLCAADETAWAKGPDFPGANWATYFTYKVQCTNVPEVINGGFEAPVVTTSQGWNIYDSGTPDLGWTVEWYDGDTSYDTSTRPEPAHLELHKSGTVVSSYEGDQYAELDTDWDGPGGGLNGEPASVKIYQDLDTCPGEQYTLTYAWSPRGGYLSKLEVYWGGELVNSHEEGSTSGWTLATLPVEADELTERLQFVETGPADSFGMFLDAVSVTPCDGFCP